MKTQLMAITLAITTALSAGAAFANPNDDHRGGPQQQQPNDHRGRSTTLVSLLVYNNAFKSYEMGMASAIAWLLFLIIMTFTVISFMSQKYWVYYGDEDGR